MTVNLLPVFTALNKKGGMEPEDNETAKQLVSYAFLVVVHVGQTLPVIITIILYMVLIFERRKSVTEDVPSLSSESESRNK